ncbi:MAG: aminotransferase class I/II-fold pyridoxal phosphate-dependent enzyme [Bacteroidota bacterium]
MHPKLIEKLNKRKIDGTFRELTSMDSMVDFYSNDYLGFAKENKIEISLKGATGSRLISGNSPEAEVCESFLASFFNAESALVFNSGYSANLGLLSSVPQRGDVILYDERIHASAKEGMRLSFAKSYSFKHHDYYDLERLLQKHEGKVIYVVVESLYSMDGTMTHFRKLTSLCKIFNAFLIIDEAHSAGIFGKEGRGVVSALEIENEVFARIITFGKAYGLVGAAVLGSEHLKKYLVNFARSFIYTTALPNEIYALIKQNVGSNLILEKQNSLHTNISFFRENFSSEMLISEINSPIQVLQIGDKEKANRIAKSCQNENLAIKPIFSPTVPEGQESIRICLHAFDSQNDIRILTEILKKELNQ